LGRKSVKLKGLHLGANVKKAPVNGTRAPSSYDVCLIPSENPPTIPISINQCKFRALMDTGADVSVLQYKEFKRIFGNNKLSKCDLNLRNASGMPMKVMGCCKTKIEIGGSLFPQKLLVLETLKRPVILGRDFMTQYKTVLSMGDGTVQIGNIKIDTTLEAELNSLVRLDSDVEIPPNHLVTCFGRLPKKHKSLKEGSVISWHQSTKGFLTNEPGISIMNGVGNVTKGKKIPITIVNKTGRYFKFNKGNVVAEVEKLDSDLEIHELTTQTHDIEDIESNSSVSLKDLTIGEDLTPDQHQQLVELLKRNTDIFAKHDFDIGRTNLMKAKIETGNSYPVRKKPYRTPFAYREEVKEQIDEMLKAKLISPSNSSWAAPILCVPKKDGGVRICCDYRGLNQVIRTFYWPLPNVDDIFSCLNGARYFSSLDFLKGYWQIPLEKHSKEKAAFVCEEGLFEPETLTFGISTAPSIFQECMSRLLNGANDHACSYLDDILVFSKTFEEHLVHLQDIFDRIRNAKFKLKKSKCDFVKKEILYLGHTISKEGIRPDPEKTKLIQNLKPPSSVKETRSFIGLTSYYRRFIPEYAKIAKPLTELTRKHANFEWNRTRQESFEKLKEALQSPPILKIPEIGKPFQLFTDASHSTIGALLTQIEDDTYKPVYYLSHQLSKSQLNWPVIEKECYAIVFAIQKFQTYLVGLPEVQIFSDHNPLKFIDSANNKNAKLQRWAIKISALGGKINFIKGAKNCQADWLSRLNPNSIPQYSNTHEIENEIAEGMVNAINVNQAKHNNPDSDNEEPSQAKPLDPHRLNIAQLQQNDKKLSSIIENLKTNGSRSKFAKLYILVDETLYYINKDECLRLEVPKSIQEQIIKETHESFTGGHLGRDKTYATIQNRYHWKGMAKMTYDFIAKCVPCNQQNLLAQATPLQETEIPNYPFQKIAIDTAGPYRETALGNRYCLTVTDVFSGFLEAFAIPDKSASTIAQVLLHEVFSRYSWAREMVSDNGLEFVNEIIQQITEIGHTHHIKTSPYHPRANGRAERPHRTMVSCLAKLSNQDDWDLYLPSFCASHNSTISASTKFSPFFLVFHRDPTLPLDTILSPREKYYGAEFLPQALEKMHEAHYIMRKHVRAQKKRNKLYSDKIRNAKDVTFELGDPVYLKNHNKVNKLDAKWLPYYRIVSKTGPYSYVIQNQLTGKTRRIHAEDIRFAKISDWDIPQARNKRKTRYVTVDSDSDEESETSSEDELSQNHDDFESSDPEMGTEPDRTENQTDRHETQTASDADTHTAQTDTQTEQTDRRPQRTAKLNAQAKLKFLQELTPETDFASLIDNTVTTKLTSILTSLVGQLNQPT
jgi:transposase InsO family protein